MKKMLLMVALSVECLAVADSILAKVGLDEVLESPEAGPLEKGKVYTYSGSDITVHTVMPSGVQVHIPSSPSGRRFLITGVKRGDYEEGDQLKQGFYVYVRSQRFGVGREADKAMECFEVASREVEKAIRAELDRRDDGRECPSEEEIAERLARAHRLSFASGSLKEFLGVKFAMPLKVDRNDRSDSREMDMFVGERYRDFQSFARVQMGASAGVLGGMRTIHATVQTHVIYQISCMYSGSLEETEKLLTEFFKVKPTHFGEGGDAGSRRSRRDAPAGYRYDLGDVAVFVSKGDIVAVNKALLELAVEESERARQSAASADRRAALEALGGQTMGTEEQKKEPISLPGFRSYRFGQKYPAARMTADMRQENGIAIKPVALKYRRFTTIELGYAIEGKKLCTMRLCADFPANVDEQIVRTEWENTRRELEKQLNIQMTENGRGAEYEDEKHRVKLWYEPASRTVRSTRLVGLHKQMIAREVNVMGLYLQLTDKTLTPGN